MTPPAYCGSIFTAVCAGEVVAPPMSSGWRYPSRCISFATCTISSSEGVIKPGQADEARAFARRRLENLLAGHHDAEVDHFEVIALEDHADDVLADVVHVALDGGHHHLAVRARGRRLFSLLDVGDQHRRPPSSSRARDFTTCGRNILPAPNRSPTTFMPSISGPSITSSGRSACCRASSVSSITNSSIPLTSACFRRSSTGSLRHSRSSARLAPRRP